MLLQQIEKWVLASLCYLPRSCGNEVWQCIILYHLWSNVLKYHNIMNWHWNIPLFLDLTSKTLKWYSLLRLQGPHGKRFFHSVSTVRHEVRCMRWTSYTYRNTEEITSVYKSLWDAIFESISFKKGMVSKYEFKLKKIPYFF